MKIGVSMFLSQKTGNPGAIAREAEQLGFESFWVAEHLVMPATYSTWYPRGKDGKVPEFYAALADPFVALATAAATTSTIKLGTAICLLPERNVINWRVDSRHSKCMRAISCAGFYLTWLCRSGWRRPMPSLVWVIPYPVYRASSLLCPLILVGRRPSSSAAVILSQERNWF